MTVGSKPARWITMTACCLMAVLLAWLFWPATDQGSFVVSTLRAYRLSNGVVQVSLLLSNGTTRTLNVVDDVAGNPALILAVPGQTMWLAPLGNQVKIFLGPTSNLVTTAWITNAPLRFRLQLSLRDLDAERRVFGPAYLCLPHGWAAKVVEWRRKDWHPENPVTSWIEPQQAPSD